MSDPVNHPPKGLPPLLHHYADALKGLQETNPEEFEHLTPLLKELELVQAIVLKALQKIPELADRFESISKGHLQLREIVGPWPIGNRDPRLDHLSAVVGRWPPNPRGGASGGQTCPHCGKTI